MMHNVINALMINMTDFSYRSWDKRFGNLFYISDILYNKITKKIITWSFVDLFPNTVAATFTTVWIVWAVLITFAAFLKNFLILLQAWTSSVSSKMANEKTKKYRNCTFKKKFIMNFSLKNGNKFFINTTTYYHSVTLLMILHKK